MGFIAVDFFSRRPSVGRTLSQPRRARPICRTRLFPTMPAIDPLSLLYANALVTLVLSAVLWMSRIGLRDAAHGIRTWIAADLLLALARWFTVLEAGNGHALLPGGPVVVTGGIAMLGVLGHWEALRRVVGRPTPPRRLAAQAMALVLLTTLPVALLDGIGMRTLWINAVLAGMAALTLGALRPLRRSWGARVMAAVMLLAITFFVVRLALLMLGTSQPAAPPLAAPHLALVPALVDLIIALCLTTGMLLLMQERLRERIERLVVTDALTGTLNRHGLMPLLERELSRVDRHGRPLSVALFDLDHFKRVNDQHGHAMGDQVLAGFAARVHGLLRGGDLLGRWGGEEFLLVLPETTGDRAAQVAERIRESVAQSPLTLGAPTVTVSGGVASAHDLGERTQDLLALLDCADRRLYLAKQGRNRVVAVGG
jgi:diguanylate cyclase (GGDEF)-like protein